VSWEIEGEAAREQAPGDDVAAELWAFEVTRSTEARRVEVLITSQALYTSVPAVRRAVDTNGYSALRDVLDDVGDGEPPTRITITKDAIGY
jgi:hypothetical protein